MAEPRSRPGSERTRRPPPQSQFADREHTDDPEHLCLDEIPCHIVTRAARHGKRITDARQRKIMCSCERQSQDSEPSMIRNKVRRSVLTPKRRKRSAIPPCY